MWFNSTLREKPYQGSKARGNSRGNPVSVPLDRWCMVVVSSCREMLGQVPKRAQPLSPVAIVQSGTLGTLPAQAGGRWGRRQISTPFISWATHVLQWAAQRDATWRHGANPQSRPQFGPEPATRLREAGIASNRRSALLR